MKISKYSSFACKKQKFYWLAFAIGQSVALTSVGVSAADGGSSKPRLMLEEVVVTARKREEGLQDAPIAISAFSGEDLEARQMDDLSGIGASTPNLVFDTAAPISGSNVASSIFIRGIGQLDFSFTTDPGVGLYVDGVYIARSVGGVLDLLDLERVEVLRGPQGTLFGRNTIGGAISLVSKKPAEEFGGKVGLTVGDDNRMDFKGSVDIPLSETVHSKFSVATKKRDGYVKRLFDGKELGDDDSISARASFQWMPSDALEANFAVDVSKAREETAPNTLIGINGTAMPFSGLFNNVIVGGSCAPAPGSLSNPACYNEQWLVGRDKTWASSESRSDYDVTGAGLTVEYDLGWGAVKSITSYREMEAQFYRDADGSPHIIFETENDMEQEQFSQEFQLTGVAIDDRLNWIVGLYYFEEEGTDVNDIRTSIIEFQSGGDIENDSSAIFTQLTFDITDNFSVTAGLRYSDETKRFTPDTFVTNSGFLGVPLGTRLLPFVEGEVSIEEVTPMINFSYRWSEEVMTYFTYSEGFKSGGFTQRVFPGRKDIPFFVPEFVEVYELGMKADLFNRRARLNAAVFFTDYSDTQVLVQDGIGSSTRNAAEAEIKGFELELKALLTENMGLDAGMGYLDAEYTTVSAAASEITTDKEFANTPEWTANASLYYDISLGELGTLTPRVNWSYRSKVYNNTINSANIVQDSFDVINASITFRDNNGDWQAVLGVTNLTDEDYFTSAYNNPSIGYSEALWARPREWSLSITRNF